ncbi:helix-turn-helix transcriptional regulator (plasmid) [Streptomyces sp. NBC_00873]|uniref:helix-turn-helix domain-containing protein n=1 Tax=unclassified Streptomyces TaxID=2593676 RepID=UPI0038674884|nr:helix-turn-helix transcriptional regulator [Streptomyces sp. NBC_00873]WTA49378.1 helix-turn-helix transcriptional regulator [Streptomyces sp. NBC_00842]
MTAPVQAGPSPVGGGPVPSLTENERTVLHRAAQGHTYAVIARDLGLAEKSVSKIALRLARKLGALNITNAVHLAHERRVLTEREDCGDRSAYLRHWRRNEPACWRCLAANAAHEAERRAARKAAKANAA